MAKATSPLFAIEASGQLGQAIVYDKRGFVRVYTRPANPRTDPQGDVRTAFRAVSAVIKQIGNTAKNDMAAISEPTYRWNAKIIADTIGKGMSRWNSAQNAFNNLTAAEQDDWNNAARSANINPVALPYDQNPPAKLPGLAMFAVARAYAHDRLGVGDPDGSNASAWATYLTS